MDFFTAVEKRRSIRRFTSEKFPDENVRRALEAAILAPNSSNTQTWDFYWVQSADLKSKLVTACLSQSAARTASHLIVATVDPKHWKRSHQPLIGWTHAVNASASL